MAGAAIPASPCSSESIQPRSPAGVANCSPGTGSTAGARRPGGGRKLLEKKLALTVHLAFLLRHDTAGDPCSDLRWTRRTTRNLADYLSAELDLPVSPRTVARLLRSMGFSLRVNRKCIPSCSPVERNAQFEFIDRLRQDCAHRNTPILSIDTKKKELVGRFRNAGLSWEQQPVPVNDHDFRSQASGLAVPHGIYDTLANRGFVRVGVSSDTSFFAVDNLAAWWCSEGRSRYPDASQLVILADCGGSNSYRNRAWKHALQHHFCNLHRLAVTVAHYPAGCSKWNPIEHRLFSAISRNWSGCPLASFELILNYIASTSTRTGLVVTSQLNRKEYQTGIQITDEQVAAINITRNEHIPKWNYTISPSLN